MSHDLENRVSAIEDRNRRVETDKAWETSWARRLTICVLTYLVVVVTLIFIKAQEPWLGAVVPVCGYFLSTLSLPPIKAAWIKKIKNSRGSS